MINVFVGLTFIWLGQVVSGFLFFSMFVILVAAFVRIFYGSSPFGQGFRYMSEPMVRPFRRLMRPLETRLRLRFDLSPFLAAAVFWVGQVGAIWLADLVAEPFLVRVFRGPNPGLYRLAQLGQAAIGVYMFIVLLRVLVTWFGSPEYHPFVRFLSRWVDPVLYHIRKLIGSRSRLVDYSAFLLLAGLWFIERVLLPTLTFAW